MHRAEHAARLPHVGRGQLPRRAWSAGVRRSFRSRIWPAQAPLPPMARAEIAGSAATLRNYPVTLRGKAAGPQPFPAQVIQPGRHPGRP